MEIRNHSGILKSRTPKLPALDPETPFLSFFVAKDQARSVIESIGVYRLQSNQFVGRRVEEEKDGGLTNFRV